MDDKFIRETKNKTKYCRTKYFGNDIGKGDAERCAEEITRIMSKIKS